MDRIGVVGISWRSGGPEALAPFTRGPAERARMLPELAQAIGSPEVFYLATCNRVEVGFVTDGKTPLGAYRPRVFRYFTGREPEPGEAERVFRAWAGEGAAEHVFLVGAGLDSAKVGETEIAGQLREALKHARAAGTCRLRLGLVLEEGLKVASRVHTLTGLSSGRISLAEIALDRVRGRLSETPGCVALVGVSAMTERCARALIAEGHAVLVVNRTLTRAEELASSVGARALSLEAFQAAPPGVEALVLATGADGPVLGKAALERLAAQAPSGRPPLAVDLAVNPDVDPQAAREAGVPRVPLQEVIDEAASTRDQRLVEMADARVLVDEALVAFRRRLAQRVLGPVVGAIQRRYLETARAGLERLLNKELSGLGPDERQAVDRWLSTLARRFAHLPSEGLKGVAFEYGAGAVEAFLAKGAPELLQVLEDLPEDDPR
ncbi:MAG: hypothetical protein R3F62_16155 [Planctomycetota bacterium]